MNNHKFKYTDIYSYGEEIGKIYAGYNFKRTIDKSIKEEVRNKQVEIYTKHFPEFLNFLEGFSVSTKTPFDVLLDFLIVSYINSKEVDVNCSCSVLGINLDKPTIFRNYDWSAKTRKNFSVFEGVKDNNSKLLVISDNDITSNVVDKSEYVFVPVEGANGNIYISLNASPDHKLTTGIYSIHAILKVLLEANNTKEAIDILLNLPLADNKIFLIADKNGNFAKVEVSKSGKWVFKSNKKMLATNHYTDNNGYRLNLELLKKVPYHSTFIRYNLIDMLSEEKHSKEEYIKVFGNIPIYQNWVGKDGDVATIYTHIYDFEESRIVEY